MHFAVEKNIQEAQNQEVGNLFAFTGYAIMSAFKFTSPISPDVKPEPQCHIIILGIKGTLI